MKEGSIVLQNQITKNLEYINKCSEDQSTKKNGLKKLKKLKKN